MATPGKLLINLDGSAWFSASPDPASFQQLSATHVYVNTTGSAYVEGIGAYVYTATGWAAVAPPPYPTMNVSDGSFCTGATPHYQVLCTVTNIPLGASFELRGFRSTTGNSGFTQATPSFTVAEGDNGNCWGFYQIRVKSPYSPWSDWSGDSTHIHVAFRACGRPQ